MELGIINFYTFASGASMLGAFVIAAFFFKFWKKSNDRLFLLFALGFVTFGFERIILGLFVSAQENDASVYVIRLVGFALIIAGIWDKNRDRAS